MARFLARVTAIFLLVALLLGGAGSAYPLINAGIELASILLIWYTYIASERAIPRGALTACLIAASALALPLLQLVPVPPDVWDKLPGRELPARILRFAGGPRSWQPITVDPVATFRSSIALLPGLAAFYASLFLAGRDRARLVYLLIAVAALSAALGALQRATGAAEIVTPFPSGHSEFAPGLFVNRNHQATFLLLVMPMTAAAARLLSGAQDETVSKVIAWGLIGLFTGGVVATESRTGFALLPLALIASASILHPPKGKLRVVAVGAVLFVAAAFLLLQTYAARAVLSRYTSAFGDERFQYWEDAMQGISYFWPFGSGFGTFASTYLMFEELKVVSEAYVNNAHNDYIEVAYEGGAPAIALLVAFLAFFSLCVFKVWQRAPSGEPIPAAAASSAAVGLVLLHSIVDYPLRMYSVQAAFGVLWAVLVMANNRRLAGQERSDQRNSN